MTIACDKCGTPIGYLVEDAYGEVLCGSCRDNQNEAAYERQQEKLMEDGGPDTSREDQHLRDAGRGHLVKP